MESYSKPVVVNHGEICWASGWESWRIMLCQWLWIMLYYADPVIRNRDVNALLVRVNHGELCCASGCKSRWAMLSQCLWIIVNCAEPVVLKHVELSWASGCESLCYAEPDVWESWSVMLSQWLYIFVCYGEPGVCELWWAMLSQWLWITLCYYVSVGVTHGELCWGSGCESCCVMLCQ